MLQQIRASGKDQIVRRSGRKDIKLEEKKDEEDKDRRKEIMRIAGWKNKREADMEEEYVREIRLYVCFAISCR